MKAEVNGQQYGWGEAQILAFDPLIEIESKSWEQCSQVAGKRTCDSSKLKRQLYHGIVGMSYNVLWGDFPTFSNVGFKLRPIGVVLPIADKIGIDISYDLRIYPRHFTAEDFGRTPVEPEGTGAEAVHAFGFGIRIKTS